MELGWSRSDEIIEVDQLVTVLDRVIDATASTLEEAADMKKRAQDIHIGF